MSRKALSKFAEGVRLRPLIQLQQGIMILDVQ